MATKLFCPTCKGELEPHCKSETCDLAKCEDCEWYGKPEENRWVSPIGTYRKEK